MHRVIFTLAGNGLDELGTWVAANLEQYHRACCRSEERWFQIVSAEGVDGEEKLAQKLWEALTGQQLNPTIEVERYVIFLGIASDEVSQNCFATAAQALRHRHFRENLHWTLKIAGVLLWPQGVSLSSSPGAKNLLAQLLTQKQEVGALRTWDFLAIVRDTNQRHGFEEGYPRLQDPTAILGTCALHLALHLEDLGWPVWPQPEQSPIWSMGAAGLFFDAISFRKNHAQRLAADTLEASKNARAVPHGADFRLEELLTLARGEAAAKAMVDHKDRPRLFFPGPFGAKHRASFSPVSPWRFWSAKLLAVYFGLFLRRLPTRLREFCHLYLLRLKERLSSFAEQWSAERGRAFRGKLEEAAEALLAAGSMRALAAFLEDLVQQLQQEQRVGFQVPMELLDTEPWLKEHLPPEPRRLGAAEEGRLLTKLAEVIGRHPLPGTLFLLAYFGALLLFLTLPWTLTWRLFAGAALFLASLAWYWLIIRERMQAIRKYLVAVVSHARWQLAETVRNAVIRFQGEALQFVREVQQRLAELRYEAQVVNPASFQASELFQAASGQIRVPEKHPIEVALLPAVEVAGGLVPLGEHRVPGREPADEETLVRELASWLNQNPQPREQLRRFLLTGDTAAKEGFCKALEAFWEAKVTFYPRATSWLAAALEAGAACEPSLAKLLVFCASRPQADGASPQQIRWQGKGPCDQAVQEKLAQAIGTLPQAIQGIGQPEAVEIQQSPVFTLANAAPLADGELWPQGTSLEETEVTTATAKVAGWTKAMDQRQPVIFAGLCNGEISWLTLSRNEALKARRQRDALVPVTTASQEPEANQTGGTRVEF